MRKYAIVAFAVAALLLGVEAKGEALLPIGNGAEKFTVRTDSLWLNVAFASPEVWTGLEVPGGEVILSEAEWQKKLAEVLKEDSDFVFLKCPEERLQNTKRTFFADPGDILVVFNQGFEKDLNVLAERVRREGDDGEFRYVRECVFPVRKGADVCAEIEDAIGKLEPWTWHSSKEEANPYATRGKFRGRQWKSPFARTNATNDLMEAVAIFRAFLIEKWVPKKDEGNAGEFHF